VVFALWDLAFVQHPSQISQVFESAAHAASIGGDPPSSAAMAEISSESD
jgi:hypothetical protein